MNETEVSIPAGGVTLGGTITTPVEAGPYPTALLLAGSGPLDRDGNHKRIPLSVSRDLARVLADAGWASLRFDKRGVGESGGDYLSTGLYDELADATSALHWLTDQPTTAGGVVAIGHSLGAVFAAEMSSKEPGVVGAGMLAYTAKTGEETLRWQAESVSETIPGWVTWLLRVFGTNVAKQQSKALDKLKSTEKDVVRLQGQKVNAKWMREFIGYDPLPALETTKTPVIAITGSKDIQADPTDLATVADILGDRGETHLIPDLDHLLRHEPAPISNPKKYKKQALRPLDDRVTTTLVNWLQDLGLPIIPRP